MRSTEPEDPRENPNKAFFRGLARAFGGAIVFALPMLMTMEMWWLGFYMNRLRLALFLVMMLPVLLGLSYHVGFRKTIDWKEDLIDVFAAVAVAYAASGIILFLLAVVEIGQPPDEIIGKISLQAVPASIGALLARSQLEQQQPHDGEQQTGMRYAAEIFLMGIGALFLAFNLAPTEEMVLIAYKMTNWHALGLVVATLVISHGFVEAEEHRSNLPEGPRGSSFFRFTVVGYAVSLLMSLYVLWTFGRTEGVSTEEVLIMTLVLGLPSAIGAGAARLIL